MAPSVLKHPERAGRIRTFRQRLPSTLARVAFQWAVTSAVVCCALAFGLMHITNGGDHERWGLVGVVWRQMRGWLIAAGAIAVAARIAADAWSAFSGRGGWSTPSPGWHRLTVLVVSGVGVLLLLTASGGPLAAPVGGFGWTIFAAAICDAAVLGIRQWRPSPSLVRRASIAAALSAAAGLAAIGTSHARSAKLAAVRRDAGRLEAAVPAVACKALEAGRPGRPRAWLRAEIACTPGVTRITYLWMGSTHSAREFAHKRAKLLPKGGGGTSCTTGNFSGSWHPSGDPSTTLGALLCYRRSGVAHIEWADERSDVYMIAVRPGPLHTLYRWWRKGYQPTGLA
jgi:hypothetical protein